MMLMKTQAAVSQLRLLTILDVGQTVGRSKHNQTYPAEQQPDSYLLGKLANGSQKSLLLLIVLSKIPNLLSPNFTTN
ncbi:hypothetical protein L2750_15065 [Shewanella submarina]|uniref:Uncharacterized protein n=1 Tax=Shewanella submarina TaxID=2016376 RepID=A0ABV7G8T2_9GAMM|nr:hypothetical protein [Shewanella submarina]MCL1038452.1 hypothetical protein [Shewanella submarina]